MEKFIKFLRKISIFGFILIGCVSQDNFIAKFAVGILFGIIATFVCDFMEGALNYNTVSQEENMEEHEDER